MVKKQPRAVESRHPQILLLDHKWSWFYQTSLMRGYEQQQDKKAYVRAEIEKTVFLQLQDSYRRMKTLMEKYPVDTVVVGSEPYFAKEELEWIEQVNSSQSVYIKVDWDPLSEFQVQQLYPLYRIRPELRFYLDQKLVKNWDLRQIKRADLQFRPTAPAVYVLKWLMSYRKAGVTGLVNYLQGVAPFRSFSKAKSKLLKGWETFMALESLKPDDVINGDRQGLFPPFQGEEKEIGPILVLHALYHRARVERDLNLQQLILKSEGYLLTDEEYSLILDKALQLSNEEFIEDLPMPGVDGEVMLSKEKLLQVFGKFEGVDLGGYGVRSVFFSPGQSSNHRWPEERESEEAYREIYMKVMERLRGDLR